jgi:hypothetical protein
MLEGAAEIGFAFAAPWRSGRKDNLSVFRVDSPGTLC